MLRLAALLSLFAGVLSAATQTSQKSGPSFCNGLGCPKFSVAQTFTAGYEKRHYEASKWVATNLTTMEFTDTDRRSMFYKLFYYISGNNTAHMKIPMTAPVIREVYHGPGPTCESTFITHFMIPLDMQKSGNIPAPTDSTVYIRDMPAMDVYVRSFSARTSPSMDEYLAELLNMAELIGDDTKYHDMYYFFAGYDGPYALKKYNEVWLQARN